MRINIPQNVRAQQLWGAQANIDINGNADTPNLVRVQLPAEYERDWTIHFPAPIFQTGAPLIATGPGAGLCPAVENVDVVVTYGGALGISQTIVMDYPTRGKTIGVRGSAIQVSTRPHGRPAALKDPCRIYAELIDAEPPSLNREALPIWTGNAFVMPVAPAIVILPIPERAVEIALPYTNAQGAAGPGFVFRLVANSATLDAVIAEVDRGTGTVPITPVAQSFVDQMEWIPIPQWAQGLVVRGGAAVMAPPTLTPIYRIAP